MRITPLELIVVGSEPHMSISSAIETAKQFNTPVWIPSGYNPEDIVPDSSGVMVYDCRIGNLHINAIKFNDNSYMNTATGGSSSDIDMGTF